MRQSAGVRGQKGRRRGETESDPRTCRGSRRAWPGSADGLADLRGEEPRLLLELDGEVLDDAGGGGVLVVDGVVHLAQGGDDGLDRGDDVGDGVGGENLTLGGDGNGGGGGDGRGTTVGGGVMAGAGGGLMFLELK